VSASPVRAYDQVAAAWLAGAEPAYRRFADALVAASPEPLRDKRVLDIGAGTGAASRSLLAVGAVPCAVDESDAMLRTAREVVPGVPAVAGDALALPFADATWDAAVSAFCINHLTDPARLLAEAGRVLRRGGVVLASTFADGADHPAKAAVETVLLEAGWEPSPWHQKFRCCTSGLTSTPARMESVAAAAGLEDVRVVSVLVDSGLRTPAELVGWRLGGAELAGFLGSLDAERREAITGAAVRAVGPDPEPLHRPVLILTARAPFVERGDQRR
jgi:ubiquinone/menaquinone biosynthesis C-methylase UbiE